MGFCDSVASVSGVMNCFAVGVITTLTLAPCFTSKRTSCAALYAAMPPVTPSNMFFPDNANVSQLLEEEIVKARLRVCASKHRYQENPR